LQLADRRKHLQNGLVLVMPAICRPDYHLR
jgi:hypothetical protein